MKPLQFTIILSMTLLFASSGYSRYFRPEMKKCQQWESSWCWAGTAQAICTWYGYTGTNEECANVITTENKPQPMNVITKIINKFYPGYASNPSGVLTEEQCKAEADKGAPFGIFWPGHFVAYGGYEGSNHLVMNPAPHGRPPKEGGQWHENCTYNYVLTAKNSTSGKWSSTVKTKGKPTGLISNTLQNGHAVNTSLRVISGLTGSMNQKIVLALPTLTNSAGILTVYSIQGKEVYSKQISSNATVVELHPTASQLTSGTYVAKYSTDNNQFYTTKICIQR